MRLLALVFLLCTIMTVNKKPEKEQARKIFFIAPCVSCFTSFKSKIETDLYYYPIQVPMVNRELLNVKYVVERMLVNDSEHVTF